VDGFLGSVQRFLDDFIRVRQTYERSLELRRCEVNTFLEHRVKELAI
jgi:hypothetical protein